MPLSVYSRTHQNSAPSSVPPDPPPMWRSLRNVMASIRVIFIGSVLSMAARVAAGRRLTPQAARELTHARLRNDLRSSRGCFMVMLRILVHDSIHRGSGG